MTAGLVCRHERVSPAGSEQSVVRIRDAPANRLCNANDSEHCDPSANANAQSVASADYEHSLLCLRTRVGAATRGIAPTIHLIDRR